MKLKILTPDKAVLEKDVASVTLPGSLGQLTVMDGHDLLIAELSAGRLFCRWNDAEGKPQREDYRVGEGLAEVTGSTVNVFVHAAERMQ